MSRRVSFFFASVATLSSLTGCGGYTSSYRPPVDGRARVVWDARGEAVVDPGGLPMTPACAATIRQMTGRSSMPLAGGRYDLPAMPPQFVASAQVRTQVWSPVYFGPPIVVVRPGIAPTPVNRPRYVSGGSLGSGSPTTIGGGGGRGGGGGGSSGGGGRGGGGGGGGDSASAAVVAAVVAAVLLPLVDVGIAMAQPGSDTQAATAMDVANAWNDLVRTPGSPCAMGMMPNPMMYLPPQKPSAGEDEGGRSEVSDAASAGRDAVASAPEARP